MKTTKKVNRKVEAIDNIVCNKCGDSCLIPIGKHTEIKESTGLIEQTISGSYLSPHLEDCTNYTFSLCEKCLIELFEEFEIPVQETKYVFNRLGSKCSNCAEIL